MGKRLVSLRFAIFSARIRAKDWIFARTCDLLLPIATTCKVCNMLRGMALGFAFGIAVSAAAFLYWGS